MSFPVCDRCKVDHNPFVSCADLHVQHLETAAKFGEAVFTEATKPNRKAYMKAYMAKRRART